MTAEWTAYEQDDQAQQQLGEERQIKTLDALYCAAMLGLPDEDIRHLCSECGIPFRMLEKHTGPTLRTKYKEDASALTPF